MSSFKKFQALFDLTTLGYSLPMLILDNLSLSFKLGFEFSRNFSLLLNVGWSIDLLHNLFFLVGLDNIRGSVNISGCEVVSSDSLVHF